MYRDNAICIEPDRYSTKNWYLKYPESSRGLVNSPLSCTRTAEKIQESLFSYYALLIYPVIPPGMSGWIYKQDTGDILLSDYHAIIDDRHQQHRIIASGDNDEFSIRSKDIVPNFHILNLWGTLYMWSKWYTRHENPIRNLHQKIGEFPSTLRKLFWANHYITTQEAQFLRDASTLWGGFDRIMINKPIAFSAIILIWFLFHHGLRPESIGHGHSGNIKNNTPPIWQVTFSSRCQF